MFNEDWYPDEQLKYLIKTYEKVKDLTGSVIEIGCWEGKSTIAIANACYPETLIAVDSWRGNLGERPDHPTVKILQTRDVFSTFMANMKSLTAGNYEVVKMDCNEFLATFHLPIKFCHIDASHDYLTVRTTILQILPHVVPGGILCGDDINSATASHPGLDGGVERAVIETLAGACSFYNLWYWQSTNLITFS